MSKKIWLITILILANLLIAGLAVTRVTSQRTNPLSGQTIQQIRDEATPVQEGVITEKQKKHGELFSARFHSGKEGKLRDRVLAGSQDLEIEIIGDSPENFDDSHKFLKDLACSADAVMIGKVKNKSSQFTNDGEFIFTDYEMIVEETYKNNSQAPVQSNSNVVVTRIGGAVQVNGRVARAVDRSFKPLEVGRRYLLFLRFIPSTGAYQTYSGQGTFLLRDNEIVNLTKDSLPQELKNGKEVVSFIAEVRLAIAEACNK
jgi:hypothetical protein